MYYDVELLYEINVDVLCGEERVAANVRVSIGYRYYRSIRPVKNCRDVYDHHLCHHA